MSLSTVPPSTSTSESSHVSQLDVRSLNSVLHSQGVKSISRLQGEDASAVVEVLDQALRSPDLEVAQWKIYMFLLRKLGSGWGILPKSYTLTDDLEMASGDPYKSGGFGDVWEGEYNGNRVAVKTLRRYTRDNIVKVNKRFCKEVLVWKYLSHPNVLPFIGVPGWPFRFCMVSVWMPHGNIIQYIMANPQANRLALLSDVASGLNYLHTNDLSHGDLKGANILISNDHRACLADFGQMAVMHDPPSAYPITTAPTGGTERWMAPELLMPEYFGLTRCIPSKGGDVYAVGMVIYEVMTGNVPFNRYPTVVVVQKVVAGTRPERPTNSAVIGFSDDLWDMVELCWHQQLSERPTIGVVLDYLHGVAQHWVAPTIDDSDLDVDNDPSPIAPTSIPSHWQQLDIQSLSSVLDSREGLISVSHLQGEDAVAVVEIIDRALGSPDLNANQWKKYMSVLRKLCGGSGILPKSYMLTDGLTRVSDMPYASGGFGDVWEGEYNGSRVAIKALRTHNRDDIAKVTKRFCMEVVIWKQLSHPNILPLIGVSTSPIPFCLVSVWMPHGNIVQYIKAYPQANRLALLSDVANGLNYLHAMDVVHGDLKGVNVLINQDHRACLADFALMAMVSEFQDRYSLTTTTHGKGTTRWMAPELINPEDFDNNPSGPSKQSDIYAMGMVIYEVMTGNIPFHQYRQDAMVIFRVAAGERPKRPTDTTVLGISDGLWQIVEMCWRQQPMERPTIHLVLDRINEASRYLNPPSPTTGPRLDEIDDSDGESTIAESSRSTETHTLQRPPSTEDVPIIISPSFPNDVLEVTVDNPRTSTQDNPIIWPSSSSPPAQSPDPTQPPFAESLPLGFSSDLEHSRDETPPISRIRSDRTEGSQDDIEQMENQGNLGRVMTYFRQALHRPWNDLHSRFLCRRGFNFVQRFKRTHKVEDLDGAINFYRRALDLRPPGNSKRSKSLNNLATAIRDHFECTNKLEDLEEAIGYFREALDLCRPGDPDRSRSLNNLALAIQERFDVIPNLVDLVEAAKLLSDPEASVARLKTEH